LKENKQKAPSEKSSDLATAIIDAVLDKKAHNVVKLDLREIQEAVTDFFIVCHGDSDTQSKAIADNVEKQIKERFGMKPFYSEGQSQADWVLLDYFDVVVHVFQRDKREFYQLEELWSDGKVTRYDERGNIIESE
jgi:ribosome-associated protein